MSGKSTKRLVRVGDLVAEVDVHLTEGQEGWPPYLSLEDAYKLDDVRDALSIGDLKRASELANPPLQPSAEKRGGERQKR